MKSFARSLVVLACTAGTFVVAGPSFGAAPSRPSAQAPVCASAEGERVCVQGWSTGLTFTFSGSSTNSAGAVFQDGSAAWGYIGEGAKPIGRGYIDVNWHGTGTLFVPMAEGDWFGLGVVNGDHQWPPATSVLGAAIHVGPSEPPPPTTCSTVAQGTAPLATGQPQPWVSSISATTNGACPGYWIASPAGTVNSVGGAPFLGCDYVYGAYVNPDGWVAGGVTPPIDGTVTGIVRTPDSEGYWLAASDGGVFAFGDAGFYGSLGNTLLNQPVVGMTATQDGKGYWLVASDGGVFAFGDAAFRGSLGGGPLNRPIVAVAADPDGSGYWLVASDGGVFAFGAPFLGSLGGRALSAPVVGLSPSPVGVGYYLLGADSAVYAFGNAQYLGAPTQQG
jgi:hypothetical protein